MRVGAERLALQATPTCAMARSPPSRLLTVHMCTEPTQPSHACAAPCPPRRRRRIKVVPLACRRVHELLRRPSACWRTLVFAGLAATAQ